MRSIAAFLQNRALLVELFAIFNLAFLALDVFLAHSINEFALTSQWIPVAFSGVAPFLLVFGLVRSRGDPTDPVSRAIGLFVGSASVALGVTGMILHLESRFFAEQTLRSLVYTAPFVAPLAYAGVGLLLLLNRMVPHQSTEWGRWIVFLALGGFVGNFGLSLADHAQNGFFDAREWIPVVSSALAVGFLFTALVHPGNRPFLRLCIAIVLLQAVVGVAGFLLHFTANLQGPSQSLRADFLFGAPIFAPLLFVDLGLLAILGMLDLIEKAKLGEIAGYEMSQSA